MPDAPIVPEPLRNIPEYAREHPTTMPIPVVEANGGIPIKRTVIAILTVAGGAITIPLIIYSWLQLSSQVDAHGTAIHGIERKVERVETLMEVQKESMKEQRTLIEKQDAKMDRVLEAVNAIRRDPR
jgi:hypothetical protein